VTLGTHRPETADEAARDATAAETPEAAADRAPSGRPAFYALAPGGWRDYVTLLHPPYTAWHLAYLVIGAAVAPRVSWSRVGLALVAFFLAVGIGAHALDELHGRPLGTRISSRVLAGLAAGSIATAAAIGLAGAIAASWWIAAFVAWGVVVAVAYNLELFGGRLHSDAWFALAWGSFPVVTGYFAASLSLGAAVLPAAACAWALSRAQRALSTEVRTVRRRVVAVSGTIVQRDGVTAPITEASLLAGPERALRSTALAVVLLAVALAVHRAG
jgi:hypothetical protein